MCVSNLPRLIMYLIGELDNISDSTSADQFTYFATVCAPYRKNMLSVVKALIEKRNVDANSVDSDGRSLLHVACQ